LKQVGWELSSPVGRSDLVFEDHHGRLLIIEVKRGKLPRGAIDQLLDYFGMMKQRYQGKPVELMVVANEIPSERKIACERYDIECRSISEKTFRNVAAEVGYKFASEERAPTMTTVLKSTSEASCPENPPHWKFGGSLQTTSDANEFLSRCDDEGKEFFEALFDAQRGVADYSRVTWDHESGFSLQFYFPRLGFAPMVWGFPTSNRSGKSIRQRLDFPFDFSRKANVKEEFINEFGAALSAIVPFSGGGKRPSIAVAGLDPQKGREIVETILRFAGRAANATLSD